jgi:cytochrome c-type biogenesis protein CcmE
MIETQSVENKPAKKRLTSKQVKLLIGGIVIVIAIGYMIVSAAQESAAYYLTVQEIKAQGPSERNVRVAGSVIGESIVWEARDLRLEFDISDESGTLPAIYSGSRPDMFNDGAEAVLEGRYTSEGVFEARTIMLKCPSKYEMADQNQEGN